MYGSQLQGFSRRISAPLRKYGKLRPRMSIRTFWMQPSQDPPSVLLALSIVAGLPIALWTYKV